VSAFDGEPQKRMTLRMTDPYGYLVFELNLLVPVSMVQNLETDWTNTMDIRPKRTSEPPTRLDVVIK
jgi:hypothetical protein